MRDSYDWQERAALAEHHGGMSREEAEAAADHYVGQCDRSQAPDAWDWANRRWRKVAAQIHSDPQAAHDALKKKHGVDSFNDLTIAQIEQSTDRMNEWRMSK